MVESLPSRVGGHQGFSLADLIPIDSPSAGLKVNVLELHERLATGPEPATEPEEQYYW